MKRILLSLLALILVLGLVPKQQVSAKGFSDVTQYEDEINFLTEKGIINGFPDGTFTKN